MVLKEVARWVWEWKWVYGETPLSSWWWPVGFIVFYQVFIVRILPMLLSGTLSKPVTLRGASIVYNSFQVIFSTVIAIATALAVVLHLLYRDPWQLFCESGGDSLKGPMALCLYLYHLNKYVELLDTVFLAARRKPIVFLHHYHHTIIIGATWLWLWGGHVSSAVWCAFINSVIHVAMYYYYLLCDLGRHAPWKELLTSGQIVQLCSGQAIIAAWLAAVWVARWPCGARIESVLYAAAVNGGLIALFVVFYNKSYKAKKH
eukprot:TRINITY_DN2450_c0_g1_i4.p1 TRINITY_DN2450_c0_g1~~TRINITY_DN2450_c0_g1_i4.p1  ORF type:complete len:260 (+),score=71.19 TRINITY_DN2450_c0_g1_i4:161-940(+)